MTHILTAVTQQASSQSSQLNSEVVTSVKRASSFISYVVIGVTQRASSSSNPIYKYELKKFKWNNVARCCSCVLVLTRAHVCLWLWCTLVCVKLPLLAYLYFPCRDTDSPSDKPHLHLQSQLLRLSLFSLISKLPLIPSVLYLAALSLLRPSWKPDVKPAC